MLVQEGTMISMKDAKTGKGFRCVIEFKKTTLVGIAHGYGLPYFEKFLHCVRVSLGTTFAGANALYLDTGNEGWAKFAFLAFSLYLRPGHRNYPNRVIGFDTTHHIPIFPRTIANREKFLAAPLRQ